MVIIRNGCSFCNDSKNIEPAKHVNCTNTFYSKWIDDAKENKKFILYFNLINPYAIVNVCPKCGHIFTEEDYDNFN